MPAPRAGRRPARYHVPMHHVELIQTLAGGLAAALFLGYLTHRLGLSPLGRSDSTRSCTG